MGGSVVARSSGRRRSDEVHPVARRALSGFAFGAAGANVVMQLSRLPVGHGVARSTVESGRVDRHPLKRLRTTLGYIAVSYLGTEEERALLRAEVDRSHRAVHSAPGDPVRYNAFDRDLQLWVAACLYKGTDDIFRTLYRDATEADLDVLYEHCARFGTSLQMQPDQWPADRAAFDVYWEEAVASIESDALTRAYLHSFARLGFLPAPLRLVFGNVNLFFVTAYLPQPFRDELGLTWGPARAALFEAHGRFASVVHRLLPEVVRQFPINAYLWDFRRRAKQGRPFV